MHLYYYIQYSTFGKYLHVCAIKESLRKGFLFDLYCTVQMEHNNEHYR